jgi:hypothetical protein
MQLAFPGWRGRLVFDAYLRLKDGEGRHKLVIDSYVDLAETRGLSLPKNPAHIKQTIKDEVHRTSSDSQVYANWSSRRPDLYCKLEKGRWGIRPPVLLQVNDLQIDDRSCFGSIIQQPERQQLDRHDLFDERDVFDRQELYIMQMSPIHGVLEIPNGAQIIKIGKGNAEERRKSLQTGNPSKIHIRVVIRGRNTSTIETQLHNLLKGQRTHGEWFCIEGDVIPKIGATIMSHYMGN